MKRVDDFRLRLGNKEYVPIMIGGMGVDISTSELALEAARLGGIGHISDAMVQDVSDRKFDTTFVKDKTKTYKFNINNMEQALNQNNNNIQAVLSENDSMATGVVQALSAVGLKIPVSGQDGDTAALNRVAKGEQAVSVWKNAFALGQTAGDVAMQLCAGTALNAVKAPGDLPAAAAPASLNATEFETPGKNKVQSIILTPTAITKDNLKDTIDAGWITKEAACAGVTAGSTPACG